MTKTIFAIFTTFLLSFQLIGQDSTAPSYDEFQEETVDIYTPIEDSKWTIGPLVGLGLSLTPSESVLVQVPNAGVAYDINFLGNSTSKSLGISFNKDFDYAFIQFGVLHTNFTSTYDVLGYGEKNEKTADIFRENHRNIEIPVLGGAKYGKFRLGVGPVIKYNLRTDTDFEVLEGYKTEQNRINFGSQAAFGVNLGILSVDIRYIKTFEAIGDHMSFGGDMDSGFKTRPSEIKLTIGTSF